MDQLGRAFLTHHFRTGDGARADVEQLRSSANWQTFDEIGALSVLQRRQLRRHHGALRFVQVPAVDVDRNDVGEGIILRPWHLFEVIDGDFFAVQLHRIEPVPAVPQLAASFRVCNDDRGLEEAVGLDVVRQRARSSSGDSSGNRSAAGWTASQSRQRRFGACFSAVEMSFAMEFGSCPERDINVMAGPACPRAGLLTHAVLAVSAAAARVYSRAAGGALRST
jgi:hypothetical protein